MSSKSRRSAVGTLVLVGCLFAGSMPRTEARSQDQVQWSRRVLASTDFTLNGLAVKAEPVHQDVPRHTASQILTALNGPGETSLPPLNANYRVRGELVGPSLRSPQVLECAIGAPLIIPPLALAGDHLVTNLRVVDTSAPGFPTVAEVIPDTCSLSVIDQLLVSEVQVRELTYDEILASGINVSQDSYSYYRFTLALATSSQAYQIAIPVAMPHSPSDPPVAGRPRPDLQIGTKAPMPETLPFLLEVEDPAGQSGPDLEGATIRIPGLIVFPGRIALLHQFFEAIVIVGNGAPGDTPLSVHSLRARIELPQAPNPADNPLRVAELQVGGPVEELELRGLGTDGVYGTGDDTSRFAPGESGQAAFLIEGLKEGLHTVKFKLQGTLDGLPAGPVTVRGEASGAVRVRDASFAVSFTHPGVVRVGQEYNLGITLLNSGSREILGAYADLSLTRVIGAELLNPAPGNQQSFPTTLKPGEAATVTWRLRARVTGAVTASYTKVEGAGQTELQLVTGVGDRNVPLSPDSLVLPDTVRYLAPPIVEASSALLGQAWSIATAPSGSLPEGVLPVSRETVLDSAIQLGVAGLRVRLGEAMPVSLVTLLRDWLGEGQDPPDAGFIEAVCSTKTGFAWQDSFGEQLAVGLGSQAGTAFHKTTAEGELARSRFLSVLVSSADVAPFVGARLTDPDGRSVGLVGPGDRFGAVPAGAALQLNHSTAGGQVTSRGMFLLASNPAAGVWILELSAWSAGSIDVSVWLPVDDDLYRQVLFDRVPLAAGGNYRIRFNPYSSAGAVLEQCASGSCSSTGLLGSIGLVDEPAPKLVGAVQVGPAVTEAGDPFGRMIALLFSKPINAQTAENTASYSVGGGTLVGSNPPATIGGPVTILGSDLNFGDRFAFVRPSIPVGPFIERTITVSGITDTRGRALESAVNDRDIEITVSPGGTPIGAYLTGRVLNADGTPVPGAPVQLFDWPCLALVPVKIAEIRSDTTGRYAFDYVVKGECSSVVVVATHPTTASRKQFSAAPLYHGQHLVIDFVFLARGAVRGLITMAGQPVASAQVLVTSNADPAAGQTVRADSTGRYFAYDVPVGGVSVLAVGPEGQTNATGFGAGWIDGAGETATVDVALQNISGSIQGMVLDAAGEPLARSLVIAETQIQGVEDPVVLGFCYAGTDGSFRLSNLPLGAITVSTRDSVTRFKVQQQIQLTSESASVTGVVLALPGYGSVSGRVIDQAGQYLAFAEVRCGLTAVSADPFGYYRLSMLSAGAQRVTATNPATGLEGAVQVTVRAGQETAGADIVVSAGATIRGTVSVVRTPGLPAVPVRGAKATYDGYHIVQTDAQGAYTLSNVPPGQPLLLRFVDPSNRLAINRSVRLVPGETLIRNIVFHPAAIAGKVFQPDGQAPAVARLTVYAPLPDLSQGYAYGLLTSDHPITAMSGSDGSYLIGNLNPAGFRISAFNDFFPTPVGRVGTLPPDSVLTCNLTLVDSLAGTINGRIFQPDGATPAGEGIEVTLGGGHLADAVVRTDATGSYSFPEVFSTGTYSLTAVDPATGFSNRTRIAVERNKDCVTDLRLLGRGSIQVKAIDGAGLAVESGTVTVTGVDYPNASAQYELSAGSAGLLLFDDLPEGNYSVTASRQGLSGRVSAVVTLSGITTVTVRLQECGTINGRVLMSDGLTPVGAADVRLIIDGRIVGFTNSSDDADATFEFPDVPVGDFKLEAYDNRSTRVGRTAGRINQHGETVTAKITLAAIGTVRGQVTANSSPVNHAYLVLRSGEFDFSSMKLQATTDTSGNFSFPGVPAGKFTLSATHPASALTGHAEGILPGGAEPLPDKIVNIALEASASLDGTVFTHEGTTLAGAQVSVTIGSRIFKTASRSDGTFRLDYVPLGEATIRAQAPSGYDRGMAGPVMLSEPGSTVPVDVMLDGTGTVKGDALETDGATGLAQGTVTLTNSEWSQTVVLATPVQAGKYEIQGAPAGPFTLRLTVPNRTAVGTANATLAAAQTLTIRLVLQPAGTVTGRVVRPDGATPAVGADVTVHVSRPTGDAMTIGHTDAGGLYRIDQVPLGTIDISVEDHETEGLASISGLSLSANGQVLSVPLLVLDEDPIGVQSVSPTNGSVGVSRSTVVNVTFTEPAKASTVNTATVKLLKGAGEVAAAVTLTPDGLVATLTPDTILADNSNFTVVVSRQVTDLVGRALPAEFRSTFCTPDETPAVVTSVDPAANTVQVPTDKIIQVNFNEALNPEQAFVGVVRVFPDGHPEALVPLVMSLSASGTTITARPSVPLAESTRYKIEVSSQKDQAGNIQPAVYELAFSTVDSTAPTIDSVSVEGQVLFTKTPLIIVQYHDDFSGIDPTSLVLRLDGQDISTAAWVTTYEARYQVPSTAPLATGGHTVEVRISDTVGNQSTLKTVQLSIDNIPPRITSFTIGGQPAADDMTVTVFRPVFTASYSDNHKVDPSTTKLLLGLEGQALVEVPAVITAAGLTYQPEADLAQGPYLVELAVADVLGNSTSTGPIHVVVDVDAPMIAVLSPLSGSQHGGTVIVMEGERLLQPGGGPPVVTVGGNPANIVSTQVGPPERITIVTPPGVPGMTVIRVETERGIGTATVFVYEPDTRTPPALEDDTVLLWHLDEWSNGAIAIADSGLIGIQGTASSTSTALPGRFGLARSGMITASDQGFLSFGSSSFMLESWVISGPISRTYMLAGKAPSTWAGTYSLSIKPTGALWGHVRDTASHYWEAVTDPALVQLTDGRWHHVAMVVDREVSLLRLYIDGVELASSSAPAGFTNVTSTTQFKVGEYDFSAPGTGPDEFPGAIDEVRLSTNARTAARIQEIVLGRDGPLALEVTRVQPGRLVRGLTQDIRVSGYNLAGVTGELVDPSGEQLVVEIPGSAATEARLRVQVPAFGPLGDAELRLHSDRGDTTVSLPVFDPVRSMPALEDDTALLMHFEDEPGQTKLKDSGPFSIDATAGIPIDSNAYPGFAGRSRVASMNGDRDQAVLDMTEESYSAELWLNAARGTTARLSYVHGYETTWYVEITALGELKANIRDVNSQSVTVATWPIVFDPDTGRRVTRNLRDGQWHHIALVVDRQAALLSVYIDGRLGQAIAIPPNFGQMKKSGIDSHLRLASSGGVVLADELRISSSAHSEQKIREDFSGDHPVGISSVAPFYGHERRILDRGIPVSITLNGFDLTGTTAQIRRSGVRLDALVSVTESSYGRVGLELQITPDVPLGPADLVLLLPSGAEVSVPAVIIASHAPRVESDTVVLWRFDEPGDGRLRVQDAVGAGSGGLTAASSISAEGRFGLGRRNAGIDAYDDGGVLAFASQSFTAEAWVKLPGYKADSVIFGRGTSGIGGGSYNDWGLSVLATGGLRAIFRNTQDVTWTIDLEPLRNIPQGLRKTVIADETWHHVALVMNREAGQAEIYVDGIQEYTAAIPAGFGALRSQTGSLFRVGFFAGADPLLYGISDETRISLTAHTPAQIWQDFSGVGPARVTAVSPLIVERDRSQTATTEIVVEGDQLSGITAQLTRSQSPIPGVSVQVAQASSTQARLLITTSPQVSLGPAELALSAAGTPFSRTVQVVEASGLPRAPDTALLWRMENAQDGSVVLVDSGPYRIAATSASGSTSDDGRFGMGRRNAGIQLLAADGPTDMGWSDFTLECWMKSGSIGRPYLLAGRQQGWEPSYGLALLPSGVLEARAVDTAGIYWETRILPLVDTGGTRSVKPLLDDKWHLVSMTVDRQAGIMKVYVDGLERGSTAAPAGFGALVSRNYIYAGYQDQSKSGHIDGPLTFPGVIDDVHFSFTLHDSAQVAAAFFGVDSPTVTEVFPRQAARGSSNFIVSLHGLGLAGATVQPGTPSVPLQTVATSPSQVDLSISLPNDFPPGPLSLVVTDPAGRSGSAQLIVTAPQAFANPVLDDGDTLVLWHLDDDRPGQVTLTGSGDAIPDTLSASSAAASLPVADGRFGFGRERANLVASGGFGSFEPATSSFTVECWVRTDPVDRTYSLVGRSDAEGSNPEFGIALLRSGVLRAFVYEAANRMWTADTTFHAYDSVARVWKTCMVTDGQWHMVSMVLDRTAGELRLYVDGKLEAATPPPAEFGILRNSGRRFRAGYRDRVQAGPGDAWGLAEFPGDLDEIRVLARARTADQIRIDFGLVSLSTLVPLSSLSNRQIADNERFGDTRRNASDSGAKPFENADQTGRETLLLWHLDERLNGAVRIVGAGDAIPEVIGGVASDASIAEAGRFAGGRTNAGITADPDLGAFDFGVSSFTLEFWLRTDPVFATYTLVGRDGPSGDAKDFGISLLPSGRLKAWLYDDSGLGWAVECDLRVDDSAWRLVTMSADREAGRLYLMLDDTLAAAAPCPAGFGGLANQGEPLRAGHIDVRGPATFAGPQEFPGVLDEVRILNYARRPAEEGK